jgi:hypothetical protein
MDTRTRWIVGILLALVIGLGVGLVIVAGDDSDDRRRSPSGRRRRSAPSTTTRSIPTVTEDTGGHRLRRSPMKV